MGQPNCPFIKCQEIQDYVSVGKGKKLLVDLKEKCSVDKERQR
jgi:hypothetical protein